VQARDGHDEAIGHQRKEEERPGEHCGPVGIRDQLRHIVQQTPWARKDLPAVPPQKPPDVDAERTEREHDNREDPTDPNPKALPDGQMQKIKRKAAEKRTGKGETRHDHHIEPKRQLADPFEVHEVGDDVKAVWEKAEPDQPGEHEQPPLPAGLAVEPPEHQREEEGNPSEEEIRVEKRIMAGMGPDLPHDQQAVANQAAEKQHPKDGREAAHGTRARRLEWR